MPMSYYSIGEWLSTSLNIPNIDKYTWCHKGSESPNWNTQTVWCVHFTRGGKQVLASFDYSSHARLWAPKLYKKKIEEEKELIHTFIQHMWVMICIIHCLFTFVFLIHKNCWYEELYPCSQQWCFCEQLVSFKKTDTHAHLQAHRYMCIFTDAHTHTHTPWQ